MDYQIITDDAGKVLAVLGYSTLALAQEVARVYARILGCATYRATYTFVSHPAEPKIGSTLPIRALKPTPQRITSDAPSASETIEKRLGEALTDLATGKETKR